MKKQFLHLSIHRCEKCGGPVVAGSLAIRESEITQETDIRYVGAACLCCGKKLDLNTEPIRHLMPTEWDLSFRGRQECKCEAAIASLGTTSEQVHPTIGDRLSVGD